MEITIKCEPGEIIPGKLLDDFRMARPIKHNIFGLDKNLLIVEITEKHHSQGVVEYKVLMRDIKY